jgi:hypothetical protein
MIKKYIIILLSVLMLSGCFSSPYYYQDTYDEPEYEYEDVLKKQWDSYEEVTEVTGSPEDLHNAFSYIDNLYEDPVLLYWDIVFTAPEMLTDSSSKSMRMVEIKSPQYYKVAKDWLYIDPYNFMEVLDPEKADYIIQVDFTMTLVEGGNQILKINSDIHYTLYDPVDTVILAENFFHYHAITGPAHGDAEESSSKVIEWYWE